MSNTTAINSELFANLVGAAQFAAYEQSIARQLVTVFDMPANAGKVVQVPVWSGITAETITDESAATAKDTNTGSASITMSEHVVYHRVTDMLRDSSYSDVISQLGDQSGRAIAEAIDTQVFAQFGDFSGSTTPAELTVDRIMKAVATLRGNKLTGPFYAVVHPGAAYNLKKDLVGSSNPGAAGLSNVGNTVLSNGYVGQVAGVQIFESALVPVTGSNATCAVFSVNGLGHAMRGTISMEEQRIAAARATDVVLTAVAGAKVLNSAFGVQLVCDTAL